MGKHDHENLNILNTAAFPNTSTELLTVPIICVNNSLEREEENKHIETWP